MSQENDELQVSPILPDGRDESRSSDSFISALKVFAWIALAGGIIGAVVMWSNVPEDSSALRVLRAQYLISGFALIIQGLVSWVLFKVVARMAESVESVRKTISRWR